jgi:hypothetical protein
VFDITSVVGLALLPHLVFLCLEVDIQDKDCYKRTCLLSLYSGSCASGSLSFLDQGVFSLIRKEHEKET